ncbi:MAG: hypothetical protein FLDDKLPJ_03604 [Phycisphaerae bacterium]|nr:hypothetical protein [Phycisphaerae bacterium]
MRWFDFDEVLSFLETKGWVLSRVWPPCRVFIHKKHPLPLLFPVVNKKVSEEYINKIETIVGAKFRREQE